MSYIYANLVCLSITGVTLLIRPYFLLANKRDRLSCMYTPNVHFFVLLYLSSHFEIHGILNPIQSIRKRRRAMNEKLLSFYKEKSREILVFLFSSFSSFPIQSSLNRLSSSLFFLPQSFPTSRCLQSCLSSPLFLCIYICLFEYLCRGMNLYVFCIYVCTRVCA